MSMAMDSPSSTEQKVDEMRRYLATVGYAVVPVSEPATEDTFSRELRESNAREARTDALLAACRFASLEQQYHAIGLGRLGGGDRELSAVDVGVQRVLEVTSQFEHYILYGSDPQDAT